MFGFGKKDPEKKSVVNKKKELKKLVKEKKYDSALRIGSEILKKVPYENDVLFILGGINFTKGKYRTAISFFEKSLEIATHDVEVLVSNAEANYRIGNFTRATQCCDIIKEIDSKNKFVVELLKKIEDAKKD